MDGSIDFASAFGRIAFSCSSKELPDIEKKARDTGNKILTPLVSLDTPGKATVEVVILADPVSWNVFPVFRKFLQRFLFTGVPQVIFNREVLR